MIFPRINPLYSQIGQIGLILLMGVGGCVDHEETHNHTDHSRVFGRTTRGEKKQHSMSLRKLIRSVDDLYLEPTIVPIDHLLHRDLKTHLERVSHHISLEKKKHLYKLYEDHKTHEDLWHFRLEILRVFQVSSAPSITPDYQLGQVLYEAHCAACHGISGKGDGSLAYRIPEVSLSLIDEQRASKISAHLVYNLLLIGLDSGLMPPQYLEHKKLWHLAFYTATLSEDCLRWLSQTDSSSWDQVMSFPRSIRSLVHPQWTQYFSYQGPSQSHLDDLRCQAVLSP